MSFDRHHLLIYVDELYEDLELWYPKLRLMEAGASVTVAGPQGGAIYRGKNGYPCPADLAIAEVDVSRFTGLVIPGGFAPDKLRRDPRVLDQTRAFDEGGKLVAFICHAGWVPISARILKGVRATSVNAIRDDMENAGAIWVDEPCVVDRHFVSARRPPDLPAFLRGILSFLEKAPL